MKKFLFLFFILAVLSPAAALAGIPQAVSITKVNVSGSAVESGEGAWYVEIKNGRVAYQENVYAGQRQAEVSAIGYDLNFWNVGEEGGKEGMLWWKKDHGLATLAFTYEFAGPGKIVKKGAKLGELQGYAFEDAGSEPDIDPVVYRFRFSGGPNGSFTELEPYKSPAGPATGRVINGTSVTFDFPRQDQKEYPYLIETFRLGLPWEISGNPFFGYETADDDLCGGFISKALEIKPWESVSGRFSPGFGRALYRFQRGSAGCSGRRSEQRKAGGTGYGVGRRGYDNDRRRQLRHHQLRGYEHLRHEAAL